MELASLFLLILMPPADATGETAQALTASLRAELGDVTMLVAPETLVTPAMWQGENASMHAPFVAHVIAKGDTQVTVDVISNQNKSDEAQFHDSRDLAFAPADSKAERGRAIALVLAELLRESPSAVLMVGTLHRPRPLVVDGVFAGERVHSGIWAIGPAAAFGFAVNEALWLKARGRVLFGSTGPSGTYSLSEEYDVFGAGLAAFWKILRSRESHYYVGAGLGIDVLHESMTMSATKNVGEHGLPPISVSMWNAALIPSVEGCVTIWRRLRLVASVEARLLAGSMAGYLEIPADSEENRPAVPVGSFATSRFRPAFSLGLELAL